VTLPLALSKEKHKTPGASMVNFEFARESEPGLLGTLRKNVILLWDFVYYFFRLRGVPVVAK
jgi:hypothetical protein